MAITRSPQAQMHEQRARLAISARYLLDREPDPDHQDQVDKNRIPTEAAPIAPAAPSKRTSDELDEEE